MKKQIQVERFVVSVSFPYRISLLLCFQILLLLSAAISEMKKQGSGHFTFLSLRNK